MKYAFERTMEALSARAGMATLRRKSGRWRGRRSPHVRLFYSVGNHVIRCHVSRTSLTFTAWNRARADARLFRVDVQHYASNKRRVDGLLELVLGSLGEIERTYHADALTNGDVIWTLVDGAVEVFSERAGVMFWIREPALVATADPRAIGRTAGGFGAVL